MSLLVKGITKLSELTIDANKDWNIKGIDSLGYVIIEDGADHYMRLPSLTTAQRDSLTPASGMTIWNSDNTQVEKYDGSDWGAMGIAGVTVRKNTQMPVVGVRPQLNLIEGASIEIKVADNAPDDEIDVTISAKYPTRFKVFIPGNAELTVPGGETGAVLASVGGTNFGYEVLDFDAAAEEVAYWEEYLTPDYLSENIVVDIFWITTDADNGHTAVFGISVLGREKGEAWDAALGAERTVVASNGGAGVLNKARITTFSPGWTKGDVIMVKLARKAADGSDTVDQDARVLKVVASYTGQFAQSFYPLPEPVELTVSIHGAWAGLDVSEYLPAGATGVILHVGRDGSGGGPATPVGFRKPGSTDNRFNDFGEVGDDEHFWAMCGVDENLIFDAYATNVPGMYIYLVGYTATGVVFFDNALVRDVGGDEAWNNIDLSAECPNAIGIIIEITGDQEEYSLRKNGSTDTGSKHIANVRDHVWAIIGCDGGQVIQSWRKTNAVVFYIVGYVTEGAVFFTNGTDMPDTHAGWEDYNASGAAPSSIMLFFKSKTFLRIGVRKNGSSEDKDGKSQGLTWPMCACDSGHIIEYKGTTDVSYPLLLMGYATWAGA